MLLYEVRDDLGVCLGDELVALLLKLLFEGEVILDDAIVRDYDLSGAIAMGMGVLFSGTPVCRPACVADAISAFDRAHANGVFQIPQFAGSPAHRQGAVGSRHRQTGGVISAILQTLEPA
jgi:hypothetical protein